MAREVNEAGQRLIKSFETCRLVGYLPTKDDVPTIGWGHTGPTVRLGMTITQQDADDLFECDLNNFAYHVDELLCAAPTTDNQFAAMVSLAYNIGIGQTHPPHGFISSSVLRLHRARNYRAAADAFGLWNKQAGRVLNGLTRRRAAEADLYRTK